MAHGILFEADGGRTMLAKLPSEAEQFFRLPPIPRLIPSWRQLQTLVELEGEPRAQALGEEPRAEQQPQATRGADRGARWLPIAGIGAGVGMAAALVFGMLGVGTSRWAGGSLERKARSIWLCSA